MRSWCHSVRSRAYRRRATDPDRIFAEHSRGGLVAGVDPLSNKALLQALGDDA